MSAPVDVLAVLDAEIERAGGDAFPSGRNLTRARAAVAELLEAVRTAKRSARLVHDDRQQELVCIPVGEWDRITDAFAKFGGSK